MSLPDRLIALIVSHGPYLWAAWLVTAYLVGRWGGVIGVVIGRSCVAGMIVILDFQIYYQKLMQGSAAAPRTLDWDFIWSTALHVIVINTILLPVNVLGWWMWKRKRNTAGMMKQTDAI